MLAHRFPGRSSVRKCRVDELTSRLQAFGALRWRLISFLNQQLAETHAPNEPIFRQTMDCFFSLKLVCSSKVGKHRLAQLKQSYSVVYLYVFHAGDSIAFGHPCFYVPDRRQH